MSQLLDEVHLLTQEVLLRESQAEGLWGRTQDRRATGRPGSPGHAASLAPRVSPGRGCGRRAGLASGRDAQHPGFPSASSGEMWPWPPEPQRRAERSPREVGGSRGRRLAGRPRGPLGGIILRMWELMAARQSGVKPRKGCWLVSEADDGEMALTVATGRGQRWSEAGRGCPGSAPSKGF